MGGTFGHLLSTLIKASAVGVAVLLALNVVTGHFFAPEPESQWDEQRAQRHDDRPFRTRTGSEAAPAQAARALTLNAGARGHFFLDGEIDGAPVRFLVDTGASKVALGPDTARAAGFRLVPRDFTLKSHTANGIARAAPVMIRRLRAGPITLRNVDAVVLERSMQGAVLLGMSFLGRLDGYEVRGDEMILRW